MRQIQICTGGGWRPLANLNDGSLDEVKTGVVLLAASIVGDPKFRVVKMLWGNTPYILCTWARPRGWRKGP
ncbi:hypothetical protein [Ottowia sp.]|uniref:hypothetical protein n=1 Tax=Ottowia sp. TaxID=1898956 RepID=UPI003A895231